MKELLSPFTVRTVSCFLFFIVAIFPGTNTWAVISASDEPSSMETPQDGVGLLALNAAAQNPVADEIADHETLISKGRKQPFNAFLGAHSPASFPLPVLPGLAGAGMTTPAGSGPGREGGQVIHVTNLNDKGPGSLRTALLARGPRIVVFDISGYIHLSSRIEIREPFLTIAGQTAPFPGISLKGAGIMIKTHDVLIQHIRIRVGDDPNGPSPGSRDAVTISGENLGAYNIVIDHVSMSWATDGNLDTWYPGVHDVTIRNSIISETLDDSIHPEGPHSKGFLVAYGTRNLLVQGNLLAHNDQRNMRVVGGTSTLFVNNVVYNWHGSGRAGAATAYSGKEGPLDASIVGNVYIRGRNNRRGRHSNPIHIKKDLSPGTKIYVKDNQAIEASSNPWSVVKNEARIPVKVRTWPNEIPFLNVKKGREARNWVLGNAGARRGDGDPVDMRVINDVINRTGRIIDSQDEVGGWPPLAINLRGTDNVPALAIPSQEIQASGYTKLEEWLHRLAKQVETP